MYKQRPRARAVKGERNSVTKTIDREAFEASPTNTPLDTAAYLGIGERAIYDALSRGDLPSIRVGRRWLVPTARLLDMLGKGEAA